MIANYHYLDSLKIDEKGLIQHRYNQFIKKCMLGNMPKCAIIIQVLDGQYLKFIVRLIKILIINL